jgi:hypothetical protein
MFDLGEYGRKSDGGISASYVYAKRLRLENWNCCLYLHFLFSSTYCSCCEDVFELTDYMMKGFPWTENSTSWGWNNLQLWVL